MFTIAPPYRGAVNQHLVWVGQELSRKCGVHHDSLCLQTVTKRLTPNYEELNGKGWVGGINDNSSEQALILFDNNPMFLTNTEEVDSISYDVMEKTNFTSTNSTGMINWLCFGISPRRTEERFSSASFWRVVGPGAYTETAPRREIDDSLTNVFHSCFM